MSTKYVKIETLVINSKYVYKLIEPYELYETYDLYNICICKVAILFINRSFFLKV